MKLAEVANRLSCTLEGDGNIEIHGVATLEDACAGQLSFLTNVKYHNEAKKTLASALIVDSQSPSFGKAVLRHHNPYLIFAKSLNLFYPAMPLSPSIHPSALIASTTTLGEGVSIGAYTVIGERVSLGNRVVIESNCVIQEGVHLGDDTQIHSGSVIGKGSIIGRHCVIQSNSVIGSDGFGYAKNDDGSWYKIRQTGIVILEDEVEVGANTTIDRATLGETRICKGVKIDNLVQIGHGALINQHSLICAQVGMAGSTTIGKNVILAGQVGVAGHLTIGDNVVATPQTGIANSVAANQIISGAPSMDHKIWMKSSSVITRLPELLKTLRRIEKRVAQIEQTSQVKL
ncbi:MAG: UDP-3-O-(3-hydroxymyristoyl)glucosamine N-acyltransferase [Acidobacteria bacterium]|nr:UDP-3-O-(3-hydroxymyristoyl)glucosamine N-acyltransferase [Acidobacteriota bacterium]